MPDHPRSLCPAHIRYAPGCKGCQDQRRVYDAWRNPPVQSDGLWALRLFGDFGPSGREHVVPARDEGNARARAGWWSRWRSDVAVEVVRRDRVGGVWVPADLGVAA